MTKRTGIIKLSISKKDLKTVKVCATQYGISVNEFFDRAVFTLLYNMSSGLSDKSQIELLTHILDGDTDEEYFSSRVQAIQRLKFLEVQ
jgi:hypothetical protein